VRSLLVLEVENVAGAVPNVSVQVVIVVLVYTGCRFYIIR